MNRLLLPVCLIVSNCAVAPSTRPTLPRDARPAESARRSAEHDDARDRELAELHARFEILESETQRLREQLRESEEARLRASVRIGSADPPPARCEREEPAPVAEDRGEAPVRLTLYGTPQRRVADAAAPGPQGAPAVPFVIPPPPEGVSTTLPVVPLPGASAAVAFGNAPAPATPAPAAAPVDAAADEYRRALELFRAGQLDNAARAFTQFEAAHPTHPYATHAAYWRGEVRYAQRQYANAASEFRSVVTRNPRGVRAPDALLKIGLCHLRMGERARARATFQEVVRTYPNTEAARIASRESIS